MIIVKLIGGLGNQMFQYSIGRHLSLRLNTELKFDVTGLLDRSPKENFTFRDLSLDKFEIPFVIATETDLSKFHLNFNNRFGLRLGKLIRILTWHYIHQEKMNTYDPAVFKCKKKCYLDGYWQSEKYFKNIESVLRNDLKLKKPLPKSAEKYEGLIRNVNSVSLHVRRGDYVTNILANRLLGVKGIDYYESAILFISQKIQNPHFFIFSDDIDWVKHNMVLTYPCEIVEGNSEYVDLYLMSLCQHNIIVNSSFSWWGAWLNNNPNKIVLAPRKWFNSDKYNDSDIIPETWIKI